MPSNALVCPNCNQIDKVQKVTALFTAGMSEMSYEIPSGAVRLNDATLIGTQKRIGITQSALSKKLRPPSPPDIKKPDYDHYHKTGGARLYVIISLFFLGLFIAYLLISSWNTIHLGESWPFVCLVPILVLYFPFLYLQGDYRVKKYGKQAYQNEMKKYNETMSHYEYLRNLWENSYYCSRCDGVFTQGSSRLEPIEDGY